MELEGSLPCPQEHATGVYMYVLFNLLYL